MARERWRSPVQIRAAPPQNCSKKWTFYILDGSNDMLQSAWENFRDGIKSEETKFDYTRKLKFFLEFTYGVEIPRKAHLNEESAREQLEIIRSYTEKFVNRSKKEKGFAEGKVLEFIRGERERAEKREISGA